MLWRQLEWPFDHFLSLLSLVVSLHYESFDRLVRGEKCWHRVCIDLTSVVLVIVSSWLGIAGESIASGNSR